MHIDFEISDPGPAQTIRWSDIPRIYTSQRGMTPRNKLSLNTPAQNQTGTALLLPGSPLVSLVMHCLLLEALVPKVFRLSS